MYTIVYANSADRHSAQHFNVKVDAVGLPLKIAALQKRGNVIVSVRQGI